MELWSPFSWLKQQFLSSEEHDSWGRSSSFTTWNIYSQFFLGASLLSLSMLVVLAACRHQPYQQEAVGRGRGRRVVPPLCPTPCLSLYPWLQLVRDMVLVCVLVSVPWEWIRLYQIEVAKKMAVLSEGFPLHCRPQDLSYWQSLKAWFTVHFTWSGEACERYQRALMVEPFWEVTPLMKICSCRTFSLTPLIGCRSQELAVCVRGRDVSSEPRRGPASGAGGPGVWAQSSLDHAGDPFALAALLLPHPAPLLPLWAAQLHLPPGSRRVHADPRAKPTQSPPLEVTHANTTPFSQNRYFLYTCVF